MRGVNDRGFLDRRVRCRMAHEHAQIAFGRGTRVVFDRQRLKRDARGEDVEHDIDRYARRRFLVGRPARRDHPGGALTGSTQMQLVLALRNRHVSMSSPAATWKVSPGAAALTAV